MKGMRIGRLFLAALFVVAGCSAPQPVVQTGTAPKPVAFRFHLESLTGEIKSDTLVCEFMGKNDVVILDPDVHFTTTDIESMTATKKSDGVYQVAVFLKDSNKTKLIELSRLKPARKLALWWDGIIVDRIAFAKTYKSARIILDRPIPEEWVMAWKSGLPGVTVTIK